MPSLKLFLLGPPHFELDGRPVEIARRKVVALLAYLAVHGQAHTRDQLASLFWPNYEPSQSYAYLRRAIWELNKALGKGWLDAGREMVGLAGERPIWLDVAEFEALLDTGKDSRDKPDDLEQAAAAASLYRGEFMSGFTLSDAPAFDTWQRFTAETLARTYASALERLVAGYQAQADYQQAIECARRWINHDPLHEPAHRSLIRLYATSGQRAAAMRQYESLVTILDDELAVAPDLETTNLHDQIASGAWPAGRPKEWLPGGNGAARTPETERQIVRLPSQPTPFVGRTEEVADITGLLDQPSSRLLSLTGPGGSGKTRLAIRVAEQLVAQGHPAVTDGVYFVGLAPLASPESIGPAIGKSLGGDFYREGTEPRRQLIDYLRHKRLLLILDNFEHLLGAESVSLLNDVMAELSDLKLMVTSRTRLNVRGEQLYPVAGMKAPEGRKRGGLSDGDLPIDLAEAHSYSSLRLFVQSARQAKPEFELTLENLPAVVRICRAVRGLPLAIELAAGWIELLSPAEIAAEIDRCLDILETELHDVPDRQRSIRAVFESSWQLLDERERRIMTCLSLFRGGFDRQAAQQVSGAKLRELLSLSSKSWLQQEEAGRFQIHELLRQYAAEKLEAARGPWQQANENHARYYAVLLEEAGHKMRGPDQLAAIESVATEFDNIAAAWRWYVGQRCFNILIDKMLPGLFRFSMTRWTGEELLPLIEIASRALGPEQDRPLDSEESAILLTYEIRARLLITYWRSYQEQIVRAWTHVMEGGGFDHFAEWLIWLADAYAWQVDRQDGARWLAWLAEEVRRSSNRWGDAAVNLSLADIVSLDGHYIRALEAARRAEKIFREVGDIGMQAHALRRVGSTLWKMGEYDQAEDVLLSGRELFRKVEDQSGESVIVEELHELCLMAGKFDQAFKYFAEQREIARALDQRQMVHESLHWESMQALRFGDLEHARALRLESLELARATGDRLRIGWCLWEMGELLRVEGDLDGARQWYNDALEYFKMADDLQGIAFYNRGFGDIALLEGDYESAHERFELYLDLAEAADHKWSAGYALSGLGRAKVALGDLDHAQQHFREAFKRAFIISRDLAMLPIYGLATGLAASGKPVRAIELAAFVANYHLSWRETRRLAQALIARIRDEVAEAEAEAAIMRGRHRDLDSVIEEYSLEAKGAADG